MKVDCPKCKTPIESGDINVSGDLCFCKACNEAFKLSQLVNGSEDNAEPDIDVNLPPSGVRYQVFPGGVRIEATTRSPIAFFLVPFMCVWSGGSLGGIYGSQILEGRFDLFRTLFGIPFLIGTLIFGSLALMCVFGKVKVLIEGDDGLVFTGIGPIGQAKKFKFSEISRVYESTTRGSKSNSTQIVLEGTDRITFGSMLNDKRRYFLLRVLRKVVQPARQIN